MALSISAAVLGVFHLCDTTATPAPVPSDGVTLDAQARAAIS